MDGALPASYGGRRKGNSDELKTRCGGCVRWAVKETEGGGQGKGGAGKVRAPLGLGRTRGRTRSSDPSFPLALDPAARYPIDVDFEYVADIVRLSSTFWVACMRCVWRWASVLVRITASSGRAGPRGKMCE